jgi:hypothetical protein
MPHYHYYSTRDICPRNLSRWLEKLTMTILKVVDLAFKCKINGSRRDTTMSDACQGPNNKPGNCRKRQPILRKREVELF